MPSAHDDHTVFLLALVDIRIRVIYECENLLVNTV